MSNQDNTGLSIFDDDQPEAGSTTKGKAGANDAADDENQCSAAF